MKEGEKECAVRMVAPGIARYGPWLCALCAMNHPRTPRSRLRLDLRLSNGLVETSAGGYAKRRAPNASTSSDTTDHGTNAASSRSCIAAFTRARPPLPLPRHRQFRCDTASKRTPLCAVHRTHQARSFLARRVAAGCGPTHRRCSRAPAWTSCLGDSRSF